MKKILFSILILIPALLLSDALALAATSVSISPSVVNTAPAENFNTAISVNPQGTAIYTVKIEIKFPADILKANSFTFGSGWNQLSQSGYDLIDNANGIIIKTAGYSSGFFSAVNFGTVSFYAKKSGSGVIAEDISNSLALDANNQNVLSGAAAQVSVTVKAALAPVPAPATTPAPISAPAPEPVPAPAPIPTLAPAVPSNNVQAVQAIGSGLVDIARSVGSGSLEVISRTVSEKVNQLRSNPVVTTFANNVVKPASGVVAIVSAGAIGAAAATASAGAAFNLNQLFQFLRFARYYIIPFVSLKKRKPWGRVLDKASGRPLAGAAVQIYESEFKKLKDAQITDSEGRFNSLVGLGKYFIRISKRGFQTVQSAPVAITSPKQTMNLEFELAPKDVFKTSQINYFKLFDAIRRFINSINPLLLILGTIMSFVAYVIIPDTFNTAILSVYILLDILKIDFSFSLTKPFGKVIDENTQKPLDLVVVRIFDEKRNILLATQVTDFEGRFSFLLSPGQYYITASKTGFEPYRSGAMTVKKSGISSFDLKLKRV